MATILITGGTGLIGKALTRTLLEKGYLVKILTREKRDSSDSRVSYLVWDINKQEIEPSAITNTDHIIHLAGANVGEKRWTKKRKLEIVDSRVKSGQLLVKAINQFPNTIKSVISASAIGWYGPDPVIPNPKPFTEEAPADNNFLGQTCLQWEQSIEPIAQAGKRLVILRTGIVLDHEGGALKEFEKPLRFGIATILGSGNQIISWIHIDDLVRLYITAIENGQLSGTYNAVAPYPISNKELILQLANARKGKSFIPIHVPAFALKIVLGEMSIEVLKSATISCDKIHNKGFVFQYPAIESVNEYFKK